MHCSPTHALVASAPISGSRFTTAGRSGLAPRGLHMRHMLCCCDVGVQPGSAVWCALSAVPSDPCQEATRVGPSGSVQPRLWMQTAASIALDGRGKQARRPAAAHTGRMKQVLPIQELCAGSRVIGLHQQLSVEWATAHTVAHLHALTFCDPSVARAPACPWLVRDHAPA